MSNPASIFLVVLLGCVLLTLVAFSWFTWVEEEIGVSAATGLAAVAVVTVFVAGLKVGYSGLAKADAASMGPAIVRGLVESYGQ